MIATDPPTTVDTAGLVPTGESSNGSLANETILVIEDSPTQRKLIARRLEESSARVVTAGTGEEAIAAVSRAQRLSLVILDYELPDMSGSRVVERIADAGEVPPFIVTTARGSERVAVEMMKQGALDYLIKDETLCDRLPSVAGRLLKQLKLDRILKEIETALRRSEHRLREIVDTNADAFVCVSLDGSVLEWNKASEEMFGLPRDHALGTSILDTIVPPERRDEVRGLIEQALIDPFSVPDTARFETTLIDLERKS
ncbi:MAG: response regulator, partial [Planctomycetota bacterium]